MNKFDERVVSLNPEAKRTETKRTQIESIRRKLKWLRKT